MTAERFPAVDSAVIDRRYRNMGRHGGRPSNQLLRPMVDQAVRIVDPGQLVSLELVDGGFGDGRAKALDHGARNCFRCPIRQLTRAPLNGETGALFGAIDRTVGPSPLQLIDGSVERLVWRGSVGGVECLGRFPILDDHGERPADHLLALGINLGLGSEPGAVERPPRLPGGRLSRAGLPRRLSMVWLLWWRLSALRGRMVQYSLDDAIDLRRQRSYCSS